MLRQAWGLISLFAILGALLSALSGCSGPGGPSEPQPVAEVRAAAHHHLTALLLVKRWFCILHVRREVSAAEPDAIARHCQTTWRFLRSKPGDPPGSKRWHGVMSDCAVVDALLLPDGSGSRVMKLADGRETSMTFGPTWRDGSWVKQDLKETMWDGAVLEYECGFDTASSKDDQYTRGKAVLPDGRTMQFDLERNHERDHLELQPDDGSRLGVTVPLTVVPGSAFWPIFTQGAEGVFQNGTGEEQAFRMWSSGPDEWQLWDFTADSGIKGRFALGEGLEGTGTLTRDGALAAALRWGPTGQGSLEPVGAATAEVTPSAAARDFAIDEWFRNAAALGPTPLY